MKKQWKEICDKYLQAFCKRHEFSYEDAYWVADEPGTTACVGDYFFGMDEIRYDVDNEVPGDTVLEWYDYSLEVYEMASTYREMHNVKEFVHINYESWCKGAPKPYSEKDFEAMRDSIALYEKAKKELAEYMPRHERYQGIKVLDEPVYPALRRMPVGAAFLFPEHRWSSVRSAASTLKKEFGSVFEVHKDGEDVYVKRIS